MIEIFKILYWIIGVINFVVAFFVLFNSKQKVIKSIFFVLMFILNGWLITNYITYFSVSYEVVWLGGKFAFAFGALIVPSFLLFVLFFPYKSRIKAWHKFLLTIPPLIITIMSFWPGFFKEVFIDVNSYTKAVYSDYNPIFSIYILFNVILAYVVLLKKYSFSKPIDRMKLRYIVVGFGIAVIIGFAADIIFPYLGDKYQGLFGSLGTIFITVAFAYSILRYRLMDIKVVIRKGVVHFLSIVVVLFLYIYLLIFSQRCLIEKYDWDEQTSIIVLVLVIVLTIEPLRRFLFKVVDKVFYAHKKSAREEAKKLRLILSSSLQFDQLVKKVKEELKSFLEIKDIQFIWHNKQSGKLENYYKDDKEISFNPTDPLFHYLQDNLEILVTEEIPYLIEEMENGNKELLENVENKLKELNVGLVWPIGEKGELIGAFFLDPKTKKEAFTSDNVQYLSAMQFQMTGAIANALLYKQAVERIGKV